MKQSIHIIAILFFPLILCSQGITKKMLSKDLWTINTEYPYDVFTKDTLKLNALGSFAPCALDKPPVFGFNKDDTFEIMYDGLLDAARSNVPELFVLNKKTWSFSKKTKEFIFSIYTPVKNSNGNEDLWKLEKNHIYRVLYVSEKNITLVKQK